MSNFIAVSDARARLPDLIKRVSKDLERFLVTVRGQPKAVFLSFEELESLEETAEILSIPGAAASIKRGLDQAKKRKGTSLSKLP